MPIVEKDPWRTQYFDRVACPDDVVIPTDDEEAYRLYPSWRWVYNKLLICESQGLEHGPHGIVPPRFPVFSKPIYNLRGMGVGGRVLTCRDDYLREQQPSHLWMPLLDGEHLSTDVALVDGTPAWWRHTAGVALGGGTFDHWTVMADDRCAVEQHCGDWLRRQLHGYSGLVNLETIGGTIIECHLRFADQWVDLYGPEWMESVVELYAHGRWRFRDVPRRTGYSVVLFGRHGVRHRIDRAAADDLRRRLPGISSIQITFHDDAPLEAHAMPPGGFRLAIVNCWDLAAGLLAREQLARLFRVEAPMDAVSAPPHA